MGYKEKEVEKYLIEYSKKNLFQINHLIVVQCKGSVIIIFDNDKLNSMESACATDFLQAIFINHFIRKK